MVIVSILRHVKFGRNDPWKDAPHFTLEITVDSFKARQREINRAEKNAQLELRTRNWVNVHLTHDNNGLPKTSNRTDGF